VTEYRRRTALLSVAASTGVPFELARAVLNSAGVYSCAGAMDDRYPAHSIAGGCSFVARTLRMPPAIVSSVLIAHGRHRLELGLLTRADEQRDRIQVLAWEHEQRVLSRLTCA
jgi:hypothetical protein